MTEDRIRDAIQADVHATTGQDRIVTDYVVVACHIDMRTADDEVSYCVVSDGPPHSIRGLLVHGNDLLHEHDP